MYTVSRHGSILTEIAEGAHMTELTTPLNEPAALIMTKKPSAAANKATTLVDQANTIDAASVGGSVFRSASDFLEARIEGRLRHK
jgi:hypothetical protein